MATQLVDQQGKVVSIGRQIGRRGGEGSAYEATSHPGFVVKLYHEPPSQDKAAKLWHLTQLAASHPGVLKFAAWPTQIVWKSKQEACGFLMPLVKGKEIHQLFGPRERFTEFPSAGWDFLVNVARNCAAAMDSVHELGAVIGDVNEGNLLVAEDGTVRLIDCDSFQVAQNGYVWTCDVGIPLWTAPELQGKNFRGLPRTPNHDCFGLATMIFKLLFMGRHPYAGIPTNTADLVLEKAIENYMFAFSPRSPSLGVRPPPHSLPLTTFPQPFVERFEQAFMRGSERSRPTAKQWAQALDGLLRTLTKCGRDSSHKYPQHLSHCPWCEIAGAGGPNFFISVTVSGPGMAANVGQIWNAILRIERASLVVRRIGDVRYPTVSGTPVPEGISKTSSSYVGGFIAITIGVLLLFTIVGAFFGVIAILLGVGLLSGGSTSTEFNAERTRRKSSADQAQRDLANLFQQLSVIPAQYESEFNKRKDDLRKTYERYSRLDQERAVEIQKLEQKKRELQLNDFLDRQLISKAGIQGIGPSRIASLQGYGIESALDVTSRIKVPGIGEVYTERLLKWRRACERQFQFNPSAPIPPQEIHQLNVRMTTLSNNLLSDLKQGPQVLSNLTSSAKSKIAQLEGQIDGLVLRVAKTSADLAVLTSS